MKTLDTSILEARIRKLQQLRELVDDPEMVEMFFKMVSKNGRTPSEPAKTLAKTNTSTRAETPRGELFLASRRIAEGITGKFSGRDLLTQLTGNGYALAAKKPDVAIAGVLKRLVKHGFLRRSGTRGKTKYEVIAK